MGDIMSKYYYHGVKRGDILEKTLDIFQKGGIKCMPGARKIGFNGLDHVSICTKEPEEEYSRHSNNAFYKYVQDSICFIISDTVEAIKPEIIENADKWNRFELFGYMNSKPNTRFSDMFDEWQVKDRVSLSDIVAIGIPMQQLAELMEDIQEGQEKIKKIIEIALALGLDIVDSSLPNFVEEYEKEKSKNFNKVYQIQLEKILGSEVHE